MIYPIVRIHSQRVNLRQVSSMPDDKNSHNLQYPEIHAVYSSKVHRYIGFASSYGLRLNFERSTFLKAYRRY